MTATIPEVLEFLFWVCVIPLSLFLAGGALALLVLKLFPAFRR